MLMIFHKVAIWEDLFQTSGVPKEKHFSVQCWNKYQIPDSFT